MSVLALTSLMLSVPVPSGVATLLQPSNVSAAQSTPQYVTSHNEKRQLHCDTAPQQYDADLAAQAQEYANTCPTGHASRSARGGAGEVRRVPAAAAASPPSPPRF